MVVMHVNGMLTNNACQFELCPDGTAVSCGIHQICFAMEHLYTIMGGETPLPITKS